MSATRHSAPLDRTAAAVGLLATLSAAAVAVHPELDVGHFNQDLSGDGVSISQLQPIFAWQLGSGWPLSLGDLQFPYDRDRGEFLSLSIGVQLGTVLPFAGQPMRQSIHPQYDFEDTPGAGRLSALSTVQLILPDNKAGRS